MSDVTVSADPTTSRRTIAVADQTLVFRDVPIDEPTPTGSQLAKSAGVDPAGAVVLEFLPDHTLELIDPDKPVDLNDLRGRFLITASDRLYFFKVEETRYEWPSRLISGAQVRKLASVPADMLLYLTRSNQPDRPIEDHDVVDLDSPGIERFEVRHRIWKLNVQGVTISVDTPTIKVRDALIAAGIDPTKSWHIYFLVHGKPKEEVGLDTVLDLREPGIEKLRLVPRNVDNGEASPPPRRAFALLKGDVAYLDGLGLKWETVIQEKRRWLLIHNYPVPAGYTVTHTLLALEIPELYPQAALYGFYAYPPLALTSKRVIDRTQMRGMIDQQEFHGWSRHRGAHWPWDPAKDSVVTQMALVEAALAKEVGT